MRQNQPDKRALRAQPSGRACIQRHFGRALALATLVGALSLGGCPVGTDYKGAPDLTLPWQWSRETNPKPDHGKLGKWWERLRDPLRKLSRLVTNYREAAQLFRLWFETSLATSLDAEQSLYSAENPIIPIKVPLARDYVALAKAPGGGSIDSGDVSMPLVINVDTGLHLREFAR